jgi:hypothetical protein
VRRVGWMLTLLGWLVLAGCTPPDVLRLHYLNEFVPGTRAIFPPIRVAVLPVGGKLASGTHEVGKIYNSSGQMEKRMAVADAGAIVRDALMAGLSDAGLKPLALTAPDDSNTLGFDPLLRCEIEELSAEKNFTAQETIHGQYFTMVSRVTLKFMLGRNGASVYENEIVGIEEEPPKPIGNEVFLPLETDPAESLSVALSRAIGALLLDAKFRAAVASRAP